MAYNVISCSCWNHSNFENSWFYYVIWISDPQNHCLLGPRNRVAVNFLNRYVVYWVGPCERACPELSEYVWQRGVGSLRPSYGRTKLALVSKQKKWGAVLKILLGLCYLETSLSSILHENFLETEYFFFNNIFNFAGKLRFAALLRLRSGITWTKMCCRPL